MADCYCITETLAIPNEAMPNEPAFPEERRRKLAAFVISLALHLLLLWLILSTFANEGEGGLSGRSNIGATVFDMNGLHSGEGARMTPLEAVAEPPIPVAPSDPAQKIDMSAPSALHSDWEVTDKTATAPKAEIAFPENALALTPAGASAASGPDAQSRSSTPLPAYDPYAGANAALERQVAVVADTHFGPADFILNAKALKVIMLAVRRKAGAVHGTVLVKVRITFEGIVIGVTPLGGTAGDQGARAVAKAMLGRKLFTPPPGARNMVEVEMRAL